MVVALGQALAAVAEWALHEDILGAKSQVIAQYGPDANAV